ncbi:(2,3-dihydroxybenzoyl)adenylate synthase [Musicola paradisiaca]|uniref:2,3-dihydroxybenzoate-AMP ligase n=1 Tax=Musicola paradisiaca (strain Ech703) TaxID=579405 RepID=C6CCK2_MUSP7|nr:(2,3-dihydroxybenzoyl)adenylate synthase [Musicola paradisiaca]ACS86845.1 2,3-dihydroxybenzoate-AMP ligase [Musicola paradisiaca Ech703]
MTIAYHRWPNALAARYRAKGYWIDLPLTDVITRHVDTERVALTDNGKNYSYAELHRLSNQLAAALAQRGLRRGDTALIQLGNIAEFYIVFFALLKIGVAPVNALFSHQRHEMDAYALQIHPRALIADRQHKLFHDNTYLQQLRHAHPNLNIVAFHHQDTGDESLSMLIQQADTGFVPSPSAADEVAFFQLSGGSTGTPKLIPRTHNDYYYSIRGSVDICRFTPQTRYLCALPAAHNYPLSSPGSLGVFYANGTVILAPDPSATTCFALIERYQVTVAALVPPAASLWLQAVKDSGSQALRSLELLQVGGARLSPRVASEIPSQLGCQLQQVFGMAEGLVNYTRLDDPQDRIFTTQGRPISPDDDVWVADDHGAPLPANRIGRLMTRGPYTIRGYYNSPQYNATVFDADGFYCSGDLVAIDEDGYITVHGREKDQINRGGEKIAAEEIENLLLMHPSVTEAALVAIEDELIGEKSYAFIMANEPLKNVEIRRFLRSHGVADYKLPDHVEILSALPLTPVGKIDKKQLRQLLVLKTIL